jgi:hypothetical protein
LLAVSKINLNDIKPVHSPLKLLSGSESKVKATRTFEGRYDKQIDKEVSDFENGLSFIDYKMS